MKKRTNSFKLLFTCLATLLFFNTYAQWQQTSGPYGGTIYSFAVNGSTIFAGTTNGVFSSVDNGSNWTAVNTGLTNKTITALTVSGSTIFAATSKDGVFLSTNNGSSWTAVNTGLTNTKVTSLISSGSTIFAGTADGGVFYSSNSASSWAVVNTGLTDHNITAMAMSGSNIFAGTDSSGVFLSTNNGSSWTAVNNLLNDTAIHALTISGTNIYAGTSTGLYVSTNNGSSWTIGGVSAYVTSVARSGSNIFVGGLLGNVYVSTNGGASFSPSTTGLSSRDILSVMINGSNIFAGSYGDGVYLSTNAGNSWSAVNTGMKNVDVTAMAISGSNMFAGTFNSGLFLSANGGTSWTTINNGITSGSIINALAINGSNIFAGTNNGMFLSTNNGSNWTAINNGLSNTYVNSLVITGSNIFAGTNFGVFLSTDNGANWTAKSSGLSIPYIIMSALTINGSNMFAGTGGPNGASAAGGVFLSTNNGNSWNPVNTGLTNKNIYSLASNGSNLYAGTKDGVFLSTNSGTSWTSINSGLPSNTIVYSIVINGSNVFAGTDNGIYLFNGSQWSSANGGLANGIGMGSMAIDASANIIGGTKGASVWKRGLLDIAPCSAASCYVWPGDADNDLTANNYDLLPIGIKYGQTGFSRDASDNLWTAHQAADWGGLQPNGKDLKYVDCNGDGTINSSDTTAIKLNFALTHTKTEEVLKATATDPALYFVTAKTAYAPNELVEVEVWAGDNTTKAKKLYGLGFDVSYTASLVQTGVSVSYNTTFMSGSGGNAIGLAKIDESTGKVYGAVTRTNHNGVTGYGKIGSIFLKGNGSIASISTINLSFSNYKAVDSVGTAITFTVIPSSITIDPSLTGINFTSKEDFTSIVPNPSTGRFMVLNKGSFSNAEIKVYDILGNNMFNQKSGGAQQEIDLSGKAKGVYFVNVLRSDNVAVVKKIVIQ